MTRRPRPLRTGETATFAFLRSWAEGLMARRPPDFRIGGNVNPYMDRWWVLPRNPLFNIYLHRILRDDDDRALHDHPWVNLSIVLAGGYWEHQPGDIAVWRKAGSLVLRWPRTAHRLALEDGRPAITLFFTGPRVRSWGFHCSKGWVHWRDFVVENDTGNVGRGCGEMS